MAVSYARRTASWSNHRQVAGWPKGDKTRTPLLPRLETISLVITKAPDKCLQVEDHNALRWRVQWASL